MRREDQPGLIVRQKLPLNLESQFSSLSEWTVPTGQFFVRSHFAIPEIDAEAWRLNVTGAVDTPLRLDLDELRAMRTTSLDAVMECAGNGRVFYEPAKEGLQWQNGAVGNARWTGVALADVLERAGVNADAVEVVLIGADKGIVDGGKKTASPGPIAFARSLPLAKARSSATLLAYAMNDEPLAVEHGFPLRAVVGGWFGMAWIKWLAEIRVVDKPFLGYWQARDYFRWERRFGEPTLVPLSEVGVKAQIAVPVNGAVVQVGQPLRIFGAAWSGAAPIASVAIATEKDSDWKPANLLPPAKPYAWRFFEHSWTPPVLGHYTLRCRATDEAGNTQPDGQQADHESYLVNWIVPVEVRAVAGNGGPPEYVI